MVCISTFFTLRVKRTRKMDAMDWEDVDRKEGKTRILKS